MEKRMKIGLDYLTITIGTALLALSIFLFFSPNTIAPGGVTGLAIIIKKIFGIKIFITNLAINVPLFIAGVVILGKGAGVKTAYGTFSLSAFLMILESYFGNPIFTDDILLATIFGGVIGGAGIGLVFKTGGTTGGTDLFGAILNKYFRTLSIPKLMMMVDLVVIFIAGVVNKSVETSLYSVIALYVMVKVADFIIEGMYYSKMFYIVSDKSDEISDTILKKLDRGVTALKGTGMYTKADKEILLCVVNRAQVIKLKELVMTIDNQAFIMITTTHEVLGEGFREDIK